METPWRPLDLWTTSDVVHWSRELGHATIVQQSLQAHDVDGPALRMMTEDDFKEIGVHVVGLRKRLLCDIDKLRIGHDALDGANQLQPMPCSPACRGVRSNSCLNGPIVEDRSHHVSHESNWPREYWKGLVSFAYINFAGFVCATVLVITHERLPDAKKYPPLPDLILDSLPHIPWAFEVAEAIMLVLAFTLLIVVFFHQHRMIITRRVFTLFGTVYLLRSVTMVVTSLSIPGRHLHQECVALELVSLESKFRMAVHLWSGCGLSLRGAKTCGDFMFSGHSAALTLLSFFITEYTPSRWHLLHTFVWIVYVFGLFFVLAAHEHYSVDVFVAVYIGSRLFLYYHTIANNRSLMTRDQQRWRLWFPLLHYFESNCDGVVPNEYGWPFSRKTFNGFQWKSLGLRLRFHSVDKKMAESNGNRQKSKEL